MKWAVYWQHDDEIECQFFKTETEARGHISTLIKACEAECDEGYMPDWDITLLQVKGEVRPIPFDGSLSLKEVAGEVQA